MNLTLQSTLGYSLSDLAQFMNRGFSGYFIEVNLDATDMAFMARIDGLDLAASRLVLRDNAIVGLALLAHRGWTTRVAAMAIFPEARGMGIGRWLMEQIIAETRSRQGRQLVLEVIEKNTAALQLYRGIGFQVQRRLVAFAAQDLEGQVDAELSLVDPRWVAAVAAHHNDLDLPWQLSGESLAQVTPPACGYCLGPASALISDPNRLQVTLRTVVVSPEYRRQGWATRLIHAIVARHPGRTWKVPVLCPEELSGLFEKVGFVRESMTQLQMRLDLSA